MKIAFALPALMLTLVAAKDDPFAGRVAGEPVQCIDPSFAGGPEITDQGTIIYRSVGKRIYVTTPIGPCPSLRPYTTLIVERFGSQQCRNDRFRVIDPPSRIPSAFCRFGSFVPWVKR